MALTFKRLTTAIISMVVVASLAGLSLSLPSTAEAKSVKPAKVKISSVSVSSGSATVRIKKASKAKKYEYKIARNSSFSSHVKTSKTKSRSKKFSGLSSSTTYYVKVRALNGSKKGKWSSKKKIKTSSARPGKVKITSITATTSKVKVKIAKASRAKKYEYQISKKSSFSKVLKHKVKASLSHTHSSLADSTTYYERVRAINGSSKGPWSSIKKVKTKIKPYLNGVDIASWEKDIKISGLTTTDFVIVKATEGTSYINPYCDQWASDTRASDKKLGFYHYARGGDATAEADYFIDKVKGYAGKAVFALDWEGGTTKSGYNPIFYKSAAEQSAWVDTFMKRVKEKTGVTPILYVQQSAMNSFTNLMYSFWIAQYATMKATDFQEKPWKEGTYACVIRQYSSTGDIKGYNGNIDLNKFYGTRSDWDKLAAKS